jgi:hypothetical protein
MNNYLDVLCIDGILGVGKTTQVVIFHNLLKSNNIPHKVISFKEVDGTDFTAQQLKKISEYLKEEPDGVVLCDGSIAIDIVDDIVSNMYRSDLWTKHKDNIQAYESLNNQYNFVNVLLTPNDLDICDRRLKKKADMSGEEKVELNNKERLRLIINGLRQFDHSMLTCNVKFNNLNLDGHESIMDVHDQISEIIMKTLQIKKPSKGRSSQS